MCFISLTYLILTYTRMHGNGLIDADRTKICLTSQIQQLVERFTESDIDE